MRPCDPSKRNAFKAETWKVDRQQKKRQLRAFIFAIRCNNFQKHLSSKAHRMMSGLTKPSWVRLVFEPQKARP